MISAFGCTESQRTMLYLPVGWTHRHIDETEVIAPPALRWGSVALHYWCQLLHLMRFLKGDPYEFEPVG